MGVGKDGLQSSQMEKKSQTIYVQTEQKQQNQTNAAQWRQDQKMPESMSAVKRVFQIKSEDIENISSLKKTDLEKAREFMLLPAESVPDVEVEQRRKSILQEESLPREANRMYVREYNAWQEVRMSQPIVNYPQEIKASNENLIRLTINLNRDTRDASDFYEDVRTAMNELVNLCKLEQAQKYKKMSANFAAEYELAYQKAAQAVNAYLTSHSGMRWSSRGRERKRWMHELRQTLEMHKKYAAQIISGYHEIAAFSDRFAGGQAQEEIETETARIESLPDTFEITKMQEILNAGEPRQMLKTMIDLRSMQRNLRKSGQDEDAEINNMRTRFTEKVKNSPLADSVEYTRILVCVHEGFKQQVDAFIKKAKAEAPEGTDPETYAQQKLQNEVIYEQYQSCVELIEELEKQSVGVLISKQQEETESENVGTGYSQPQNQLIGSERINRYKRADKHLPSTDSDVEFLKDGKLLPTNIQNCGDKKVLKDYLRDNPKLASKIKRHLQHRIDICDRLDKLEKAKTNVIPSACKVYRGEENVSFDQADRETDRFLLEDVIQSHYQTHGNSCWSAAAENLFRQRGVFLHQVDIRGYRDSGMSGPVLNELLNDNQHDMQSISNLVGKVMKNTALCKLQMMVGIDALRDRDDRKALVDHLKHTFQEAIIDNRSAIAICYRGHYRTIVGIQGNTVYYKNSSRFSSFNEPDKTYQITIQKLINDASTKEGLDFEMYWMKDIPEGTDLTQEYNGKLSDGASLNVVDGEYRISKDKTKYRKDQTMVDIGWMQNMGKNGTIFSTRTDFIPRYAK